jgi:hypothetical protein
VNTIQSNNLEKMREDARYNEAAALRNERNIARKLKKRKQDTVLYLIAVQVLL